MNALLTRKAKLNRSFMADDFRFGMTSVLSPQAQQGSGEQIGDLTRRRAKAIRWASARALARFG